MSDESTTTETATTYQVDSYRWIVLICFSLSSITTGILWISFASISDNAQEYYSVSASAINLLSVSFMILYLVMTPVASFVLGTYGFQISLLLGAGLNGLGSMIRWIGRSPDGFSWLAIGQIIAGIAQPFILAAPPKLASNWFSASERGTATSIATLANAVGVGLGFLIGPLLVSSQEDIPQFLTVVSFACTASSLITMIGVRDRPSSDPSKTATSKRSSFMVGLTDLIHSPSYMILFFIIGLLIGAFNAVTTLLNQILVPLEYKAEIGLFGNLIIGGGLVGSYLAGLHMDKYQDLDLLMKILTFGSCASFFAFLLLAAPNSTFIIAIICTFIGVFLTALFPIGFQTGVECSYPVNEGTSAGLLMMSGQLFGIPATIIGGLFPTSSQILLWIAAWSILPIFLVCFLRVPYNRRSFERDENISSSSSSDNSPSASLLENSA